ncbi:Methionine aminopeptidase 1 [Bifiguratus adelaidae]|uniref:Methionine aminopeptidase n=1 Tax=Bifiguratus adelaidae TaxID=1938954 RepID=A0A261XYQ2_9FUNG|nr:Methionine aminopeptidase 1 [Bifiguratus adelaidae]
MDQHTCITEGCGKPAKLQCPTCLKQGIPGSYFCSQECFKSSWPKHKIVHKVATGTVSDITYNPFKGYSYTGDLRAVYPLSPKRQVPKDIPRPDYAEDGVPRSEQRLRGSTRIEVLNADEIEIMRRISKLAREVLDIGAKALKVGVTTDEIDRIVHEATIARGAYPSPLNYWNFPKSVCTSVNEVICHGIPDKRPLKDGDIVNIDVTLYKDGFHSDLNETYCVGTVDEAGIKLVNTARECLNLAIAEVKPGALFRDFGKVIEAHAKSQGFSTVKTFCGHGINRLFHCPPNVPHYAKNKAIGVCKPGVCFTIEPMICEGSWRDELWPDNWTAVTTDGRRSAQFEHTLLVTEDGVEILTA